MSANYYAEINLHITWHTKQSAPLLTPKIEAVVQHSVSGKPPDRDPGDGRSWREVPDMDGIGHQTNTRR
jgi:hypothetical protein